MNRRPTSYYGESKVKVYIRKYLIYVVVIAFIIAGIVATVKLYNASSVDEDTESQDATILRDATSYYLAMYEPTTFDVLKSSDEDVMYLNSILYSYLFRLDENLNLIQDLVQSYTVNREEGIIDINLREDAIFSNNTHVYASDVAYTVAQIMEAGEKSPYYNYAKKIEKVEPYDAYSLIIEFTDPNNASLDNLVFPIISQEDYVKGKEFAAGSGQYVYGEHAEGKYLRLIPNPFYYGDKTDLIVEITLVRDRSVIPGLITMDAVCAYLNKEEGASAIAEDKSIKYTPIVSNEMEYLAFNCNNALLKDSRIRYTIATAIDRETIIDEDYGHAGVVSDSLYFPGFLGADKNDTIPFEPKAGSDLLSAFGLKDLDEDGILETPQSEDVSFTLIVDENDGDRVNAAYSIEEDLSAIGIGIEVSPLTTEGIKYALETGGYDLYLGGIIMDKQANLSDLYGKANYSNYSGERVIELTKELEKMNTPEEQSTIFAELKSILRDEMPYFSICYKTYCFMSVDTLDTISNVTFFDPYRGLGVWKWQQKIAS